jgi:hypothetical protein
MELKEFVKQTIIQITDGIREGHNYIAENNYGDGVNDEKYKEVNFDVAVTSNEESTTGVGGSLSVASVLSLSGKDETTNAATNTSRIQFRIFLHVKADS